VQDIYLEIQEWEEVRQVNFLLAQELETGRAGGILRVQVRSPSGIDVLLERLASISEIVGVDSATRQQKRVLTLSTPARIGLLIGLAMSAFASLIVARRGFGELLSTFAREIRLMRLSGTPEKTIHQPIVVLGVLCGLLASLLLIAVVYLLHYVAVSHPEALLRSTPGLVESGRVLTVSLLSLLLGLAMGGLIGVVGASLTSSREFQSYS
jgi:cell division protein FtsX